MPARATRGPKRRLRRPADVAPVDPHPHGVEPHARPAVEVEHDARDVASLDAGCDRHEHRPVAGEPLRRAAHGRAPTTSGGDARSRAKARPGRPRERASPPRAARSSRRRVERLEHVSIVVRAAGVLDAGGGLPPEALLPRSALTGSCLRPRRSRTRPARPLQSRSPQPHRGVRRPGDLRTRRTTRRSFPSHVARGIRGPGVGRGVLVASRARVHPSQGD